MKVRSTRKRLKEEARNKHDESKNNLHEGSFDGRVGKLARQDLDSVLQVDPGDEKAEGVAGETGNIFEEVTPYESYQN